jgi:hypothetical protein
MYGPQRLAGTTKQLGNLLVAPEDRPNVVLRDATDREL